MQTKRDAGSPVWERLLIAIAAPIVVASVLGIFYKIEAVRSEVGHLATSQAHQDKVQAVIQSQLAEAQARLNGIYTQREAEREHKMIWRTDKDQYQRLEGMTKRLRDLEQHAAMRMSHMLWRDRPQQY